MTEKLILATGAGSVTGFFTAGDAAEAKPHREAVEKDAARTSKLLAACSEMSPINTKLADALGRAVRAKTDEQVKNAKTALEAVASFTEGKAPRGVDVLENALAAVEGM